MIETKILSTTARSNPASVAERRSAVCSEELRGHVEYQLDNMKDTMDAIRAGADRTQNPCKFAIAVGRLFDIRETLEHLATTLGSAPWKKPTRR